MANQEHLNILRQGIPAWNEWRKENPDIIPNLRDANLSDANLSDANLYMANLRDANLYMADLRDANLSDANLYMANLYMADLSDANLSDANLYMADLRDANLYRADLRDANLYRADLRDANIDFASWPLWCGSAKVIIDERIARQLLAHAFQVVGQFCLPTPEQVEFCNGFHRIQSGEFPKIELPE